MTIYVNKDGTMRVDIDESDRGVVNHYKALGYRPDTDKRRKHAPPAPDDRPEEPTHVAVNE